MGQGISYSNFIFDNDDSVNGWPYPEDLIAPDYKVATFSTDFDLEPGFAKAIVLGDGFDPKLHIYATDTFPYTKVAEDDDSFGNLNPVAYFFTDPGVEYDAVVESLNSLNPGETRDFYFEAQVDSAGDDLFFAYDLNDFFSGTLPDFGNYASDFVGVSDANDYYTFTLDSTQTLDLFVGGLTADVDVELLDANGFYLNSSFNSGTDSESIRTTLGPGTYYAHVYAPFAYDTARAIRSNDVASNYYLDLFPVGTTPINRAPESLTLSSNSINENNAVGSTIGTFSAIDPDGDTLTYRLVSGAGGEDNSQFTLEGNVLKAAAKFDYEAKTAYQILVEVSDGNGGILSEPFTVEVKDENDTGDPPPPPPKGKPTDIGLTNLAIAENLPAGTAIGNLTTTDPTVGDTHTYSLIAGTGDFDNQ